MKSIATKDIEAFGRVLKALGQFCEENPKQVGYLLSRIETSTSSANHKTPEAPQSINSTFQDLDSLNVFDFAKGKSREELLSFFLNYDIEQLRYITRRNRFGALKTRSVQTLVEHLVDQIMKRVVDVFKTHE